MKFHLILLLGLSVVFTGRGATVPPAAPSNVAATFPTMVSVNLTWRDNSTNETNFRIYSRLGTNGTFNQIGQVGANTTNFTAGTLTPNQIYQFRIQARADTVTADSEILTVQLPIINSPGNLTVTLTAPTTAQLRWTDDSTNEVSYLIGFRIGTNGSFGLAGTLPANSTNATIPGLASGTTYQFLVETIGPGPNVFADSIIVTVAVGNFLTAPTNLTVVATSPGSANLTWTDTSTNETAFFVGWRPGTTGSFSLFPGGSLASNTTSFTANGLAPGSTNQFFIEAFVDNNNVADSATVTVVMPPFPVPSNLTATALSPSQIRLTWKDNTTNETKYFVAYRIGTNAYTVPTGGELPVNATNFTFTNLSANVTYELLVEAYYDDFTVADATVLKATQPLPAASNLTATALNPSQIRVTWKDNATNETKYFVAYRIGTNAYTVPTGGELPANTTNYTFTNLAANVTYELLVEAYYDDFSVADTTILQATQPLLAPSNLTATALSPSQLRVTWKDNATNENRYYVAFRVGTNGNFIVPPDAELPANTTNYTFTNLASGTQYQLLVQSYFDDDAFASTLILGSTHTLLAPSNLTATALSPSQVRLTWNDNATNETKFLVAYRVGNSGGFTVPQSGELPVNSTNFTVTNLSPGTAYEFLVQTYYDTNATQDATVSSTTPDGFNSRAFHPAVLNQPISAYTLSATATAEAPAGFGVAGLPPGLSFDGVDQITGTPLQAGVFVAQMTVQYPVAGTVTNPLTFRVIHPAGPPVVVSNLPNHTLASNSAPVQIPLNPHFTDPDTESAVRFVTTKGNYDLAIYNTATPQTAAYFLGYVDRGDYSNSVINRASPSGFGQNFVLQSGALRPSGTNFTLTPTTPSPINEPGIQHVRGTVALAKQAGRPNSGSIDWFINMKDNSGELDNQNQGFAAFARVCANGISVADSILALPRNDYTVKVDGLNRSYDDWPLDTPPPAPATMDSTKLVLVNSVTRISTLAYSVAGNSAPAIASAVISNGSNLVVTPLTQFGGTTTISVAATDLDGNRVTNEFTVQVAGAFTTWANSFSLTGTNALPSANGDGDTLPNAAEFALMSSPALSNSTASLITRSFVTVSNAQYLALTFRLRKDLGGAVVLVRGAAPLGSAWTTIWTSADLNGPLVVQKIDQGDAWLLTVRDSVPASPGGSARFLNVQVQTPP